MKRIFSLIALAALTAAAQAETITLGTVSFGPARNCQNIPADTGADVDLYASTSYASMTVYIDGVAYSGPNTPAFTVLYSQYGQALTFSADITTTRRYVSGRGARWVTKYTLQSGTAVR